jgi:hypothetical protein
MQKGMEKHFGYGYAAPGALRKNSRFFSIALT